MARASRMLRDAPLRALVVRVGLSLFALLLAGCKQGSAEAGAAAGTDSPKPLPSDLFGGLEGAPVAPRALVGTAGQGADSARDTSEQAPVASSRPEPAGGPVALAPDGVPRIAATTLASIIFARPNREAERLGYLRLGGSVERVNVHVQGGGCKGEWYEIKPRGFVCSEDATTELSAPLVRAAARRPALDRPLPYSYGFVRATSPQYLRVPSHKEQVDSEFKLDDHLAWFRQNESEVQRVALGANDVPLNAAGVAVSGTEFPPDYKLSTELDTNQLFGGLPGNGVVPDWFSGARKIPNVSGFNVPEYAIFADRVRRKTGLSFVDAFVAESDGVARRFAVSVDLRLIPTSKVKPDTGSAFHGLALNEQSALPFALVLKRDVTTYKLLKGRDEVKAAEGVPRRAAIPLTGKVRMKSGARFYQVLRDPQRWLKANDIGVVAPPPSYPEAADKNQKWIDISLVQQTLVLYQGRQAVYATLVSTGQDRLGDPKTQKATPRGTFQIQSKHVAAAMDSEENSSVSGGQKTERHLNLDESSKATVERLKKAETQGLKLNEEDRRRLANIKKGRHPEYGVTHRRGAANFELRDVPWIQYFAAGFALHGAYWHDVFGTPRSHGCVNLAPIDARYVFMWTDPPLPDGWHGFNTGAELGEGTVISIRE